MRYRSNLVAPDLRPQFTLLDPPKQIMGHDAPSDPGFQPECTYWTDDEAAILYHVARQIGGVWVDIGARLGWTAAHLIAAGVEDVWAVDPEYKHADFMERAFDNCRQLIPAAFQARDFFHRMAERHATFAGFVVDGDHDDPQPTCDALGCLRVAKPDCVILMHDFLGRPIQDAVMMLMHQHDFHCRVYDTPNGVALLWRGHSGVVEFQAPDHTPDPAIDWAGIRKRALGFDWAGTE